MSTCLLISEVNDELHVHSLRAGTVIDKYKDKFACIPFISFMPYMNRGKGSNNFENGRLELNREYFLRYQTLEIFSMSVSKDAFSVTLE
jgi:hypothetical protein